MRCQHITHAYIAWQVRADMTPFSTRAAAINASHGHDHGVPKGRPCRWIDSRCLNLAQLGTGLI